LYQINILTQIAFNHHPVTNWFVHCRYPPTGDMVTLSYQYLLTDNTIKYDDLKMKNGKF